MQGPGDAQLASVPIRVRVMRHVRQRQDPRRRDDGDLPERDVGTLRAWERIAETPGDPRRNAKVLPQNRSAHWF